MGLVLLLQFYLLFLLGVWTFFIERYTLYLKVKDKEELTWKEVKIMSENEDKHFKYLTSLIENSMIYNSEKLKIILKKSINPRLTSLIFLVENINRGDYLTRSIEVLLIKLAPNFVVKFDLSIGPFQIKYSFANNLMGTPIDITKLLDLSFSIHLINKFIKQYAGHYNSTQLIRLYHSGDVEDTSVSSQIYIELYKWFEKNFSLKDV